MESRKLFKNVAFSGFIQATNVIIPLIVFPYIISRVGSGKFGIISIALTFTTILNLLVDYSFSTTAITELMQNKARLIDSSKLFYEVFIIRFIFALIAICFILFCACFYRKFNFHFNVFVFASFIIVGQALSPLWYFQGIENFFVITLLNFFSKVLFMALTFIYVRQPTDYYLVPLFFGFGNIISGIMANVYILKFHKINLTKSSYMDLMIKLKEGWSVFTSNASIVLYMHLNVLFLSFFASESAVGLYSISERIIIGIRQILGAFASAMYPRLNAVLANNSEGLSQLLKAYRLFAILIFIGCCVLVACSHFLLSLFLKIPTEIEHASMLLMWLSPVPFIVALNIPANQILLSNKYYKLSQMISFAGVLICFTLNILLMPFYQELGTILTIISVETFITLTLYWYLQKKEYGLFRKVVFNK